MVTIPNLLCHSEHVSEARRAREMRELRLNDAQSARVTSSIIWFPAFLYILVANLYLQLQL